MVAATAVTEHDASVDPERRRRGGCSGSRRSPSGRASTPTPSAPAGQGLRVHQPGHAHDVVEPASGPDAVRDAGAQRDQERAPDRRNTVLLLDTASAAVPWELFEDGLRARRPRTPPTGDRGRARPSAGRHRAAARRPGCRRGMACSSSATRPSRTRRFARLPGAEARPLPWRRLGPRLRRYFADRRQGHARRRSSRRCTKGPGACCISRCTASSISGSGRGEPRR